MQEKNKIIFSLILIIILVFYLFSNSLVLSKEKISTEFVLGENMGFDLSPGKLNFGKIVPNNSASREITIENNFKELIKVSIKSSGEISKYIIVSENNFQIRPSESKNITFTAYTDDLTEYRTYKGEITIISKKF